MNNLQRIIDAYTKMDQRRKAEVLEYMEGEAAAHPERRPVKLVLVPRNSGNNKLGN